MTTIINCYRYSKKHDQEDSLSDSIQHSPRWVRQYNYDITEKGANHSDSFCACQVLELSPPWYNWKWIFRPKITCTSCLKVSDIVVRSRLSTLQFKFNKFIAKECVLFAKYCENCVRNFTAFCNISLIYLPFTATFWSYLE